MTMAGAAAAIVAVAAVCGPGAAFASTPRCSVDRLAVSTPGGDATGGTVYVRLTFTNTSRSACSLEGHPGVSLVGHGDGTQIGPSAVRRGPLRVVRLAPAHSTNALVTIVEAEDFDASTCRPIRADGFRVYPPGSTRSVFVPLRTLARQRNVHSGSELTVSSVGVARPH